MFDHPSPPRTSPGHLDGSLHDGLDRAIDVAGAVGGQVDDRALTDAAMHAARLADGNARRHTGPDARVVGHGAR